jgi:regulator of replication initiation timing
MSDTPITDAEAYDYETGMRWLDGVVSAHIVRKLERENAALKEQLNHTVSTKYHDEIVQEAVSLRVKETDNLRSELRIAESFHRIAVSERDALVVENAALRADNAMLRQILDLTLRIPDMSDSELKELIQNCKAASARKEKP